MSSELNQPNSIPALLRELRDETTTLLRQEVSLAKAELTENVNQFASHSLQIAIGGFVAYAGLVVLLIGIGLLLGSRLTRAGMSPDVAQWFAPAVLGLIVALIGAGLALRAKRAMATEEVAPRKTTETIREDKPWAQRKLQSSS